MNTGCYYGLRPSLAKECKFGFITWWCSSMKREAHPLCPAHVILFKKIYSGVCVEIDDEDEAFVHNLMIR